MLDVWVVLYILKIIVFVFLASFFLLEIERDDPVYHYLAMTSTVNINFFICDHHKNMKGQDKITTIQECTSDFLIVEWLVFFPILAFMVHTIYNVIFIRNDLRRNLIKPDYQSIRNQQFSSPHRQREIVPDGAL